MKACDLEGVGEGLSDKVWEVAGELVELLVLQHVGVDKKGDGGRHGHQGHLQQKQQYKQQWQ